jgi:hypothetical protein
MSCPIKKKDVFLFPPLGPKCTPAAQKEQRTGISPPVVWPAASWARGALSPAQPLNPRLSPRPTRGVLFFPLACLRVRMVGFAGCRGSGKQGLPCGGPPASRVTVPAPAPTPCTRTKGEGLLDEHPPHTAGVQRLAWLVIGAEPPVGPCLFRAHYVRSRCMCDVRCASALGQGMHKKPRCWRMLPRVMACAWPAMKGHGMRMARYEGSCVTSQSGRVFFIRFLK